jgi:hypothetical protein
MFALLLTIVASLAVTVAIHALGTVYWIRHLGCRYVGADGQFKAHSAAVRRAARVGQGPEGQRKESHSSISAPETLSC